MGVRKKKGDKLEENSEKKKIQLKRKFYKKSVLKNQFQKSI